MPQILDGFAFDDFMTRGATIYPLKGINSWQEKEFETPIYTGDYALWFQESNEKFRNAEGNEVIAKAEIITKYSVAKDWKRGDYMVLDSDSTGTVDPILAGGYEIDAINKIASDAICSEDAYQIFVR